MILTEKYRPHALDEVVGQEPVVNRLRALFQRGIGGRAFWISGLTGCGKTTLAHIIARQIASDWTTEELDSGGLTPAALADWERKVAGKGLGGHGWALIINEAHGLRKDTIRQLLVTLERLPAHVVVVFTTTEKGQKSLFDGQIDSRPLVGRCINLELSKTVEALPAAIHVHRIATVEGLTSKGISEFIDLIRRCQGSLREAIQAVDGGEMA